MELFLDIFSGIDFTDSRVQIFSVVFVAVIFLTVLVIFFVFKIFIPKSKMRDIETINSAIIRLEKLMLFDRVVLISSASIAIIIAILHLVKVIDVFQLPFPFCLLFQTERVYHMSLLTAKNIRFLIATFLHFITANDSCNNFVNKHSQVRITDSGRFILCR